MLAGKQADQYRAVVVQDLEVTVLKQRRLINLYLLSCYFLSANATAYYPTLFHDMGRSTTAVLTERRAYFLRECSHSVTKFVESISQVTAGVALADVYVQALNRH